MTKKRVRKYKRPSEKVVIDLADWELGEWPEKLSEAHIALYEKAAKDIAKEAIEAFFRGEDSVFFDFTSRGLKIWGESFKDCDRGVTIPWHHLSLFPAALKPLLKWVEDEKTTWEDPDQAEITHELEE